MNLYKDIRLTIIFFTLTVLLIFSIIYTISIGSTPISSKTVFGILVDKIFLDGKGLKEGIWAMPDFQIVWNIRLPRVLFGLICGMGLSVCGVVMQSLVMNSIADPYILGISSGASAGASFALLIPLPFFQGQYQTSIIAMVGAFIASFMVYYMAKITGGGRIHPVSLLLSGTSINALMSAITNFLIFIAKSPESISAVYNWQMGTVASASWNNIRLPFFTVFLGLMTFIVFSPKLNMLMLGDEYAYAMGVNVKRFRFIMFFVCSLIVASLVSVTGIIGFVGLVIPHIVRLLVKSSNNRVVIPLSAILGSIYLIWSDALARSLFYIAELPIGIITAFIGAPCLLYLMIKRKFGG